MKKKNLFLLALLVSVLSTMHAQPVVAWSTCIGAGDGIGAHSLLRTSDGGYMVLGCVNAGNGVTGRRSFYTGYDVWMAKLNDKGVVQWSKYYGGSLDERISDNDRGGGGLIATKDGNYVFVASSYSLDGDLSLNKGEADLWVVKIDGQGSIMWKKTYGGRGKESNFKIQETPDEGFIVAGTTTSSNTGDVSGYHGKGDGWVLKLDQRGELIWQTCLGSFEEELSGDVVVADDGGYLVALSTCGNDGDVSGNHHASQFDWWLVKLQGNGQIEWQRCLGGFYQDCVTAITKVPEGYVLVGYTFSNDGDIKIPNNGLHDFWVVKIERDGSVVWSNTYGRSLDEYPYSIMRTTDEGFVIAGMSESPDGECGDTDNHFSQYDGWVIKVSSAGSLEWAKSIGGAKDDYLLQVAEAPDGSLICIGSTLSHDGDARHNAFNRAVLLVKLLVTGR